eukprot:TRINITY_DN16103_c0_g1_i1.p1 TRINITY_DN16103_c0_g1~~TRINITY_DN16103_c0_g1_i1.p1  ORF type:complete len:239 (-),score=109.08 TRINITY_DN16103_c0_g1_i1:115-831(-)
MRALLSLLPLALAPLLVDATAQGALKLDNYTFDKVIAIPGKSFLVKFDQSYAYGEKEDEFKALCRLSYAVPDFLVAEVPVQEYGDKENEDVALKYNVNKADYPAYFLFNEANKDGLKYAGDVKADAIISWLRRNKIKMPSVGTIAEMDEVAKAFLKSGLKDEHVASAKKMAEGEYSNDKKASMYVKIMEKIKEKGEAYVETESKRVTKILEGKVTPEKKVEMQDKLKILGIFAEKDEL